LERFVNSSAVTLVLKGILVSGGVFDEAIVSFATTYADQSELDHLALVAAIKSGHTRAHLGV
jgi:hypothetical protein